MITHIKKKLNLMVQIGFSCYDKRFPIYLHLSLEISPLVFDKVHQQLLDSPHEFF